MQKDIWGKVRVGLDESNRPVIESALKWLSGEASNQLFEKSDQELIDNQVDIILIHLLMRS